MGPWGARAAGVLRSWWLSRALVLVRPQVGSGGPWGCLCPKPSAPPETAAHPGRVGRSAGPAALTGRAVGPPVWRRRSCLCVGGVPWGSAFSGLSAAGQGGIMGPGWCLWGTGQAENSLHSLAGPHRAVVLQVGSRGSRASHALPGPTCTHKIVNSEGRTAIMFS